MSAPGNVPPTRAIAALTTVLACALALSGCDSTTAYYPAVSSTSPSGTGVALAQVYVPCDGACWILSIGDTRGDARVVDRLEAGRTCTEIAWTKDGSRVAFVIDGYQLRLYDAATRRPAGQFDLFVADGDPPTRIARGVTFSENGRAVTFDDCPRGRSGCRAGLAAVPGMEDAR